MPNPFNTKFDSKCQNCDEIVYEGEEMYAHEGTFICPMCAKEADIVCPECNRKKSESYEKCYYCYNDIDPNDD